MEDDTIKLLRECNAGIKMGISSIEEVMDRVEGRGLQELLRQSLSTHRRLGNATEKYLEKYQDEGKEPAAIAKMMSWVKTNGKLAGEESDRTIADLITDGCNMGIKSLYRYLHQYPAADAATKEMTTEIIKAEDTLARELRDYL